MDGREERIRTSGLLLPKQALYQAELPPDRGARGLQLKDFRGFCNPARDDGLERVRSDEMPEFAALVASAVQAPA